MAEYDLATAIRKAYEVDNKVDNTLYGNSLWEHGDLVDAKSGLLLVCKKYVSASLDRAGFVGRVYAKRGNKVAYLRMSWIDINIFSAYSQNIVELDNKFITPGDGDIKLVEITYLGEPWYAVHFEAGSSRYISTHGIWSGTPVLITDATSYTVTDIVTVPNIYSKRNKPTPLELGASKGNEFYVDVIPGKWTRIANIYGAQAISAGFNAHNIISFTHTRGNTVFGGVFTVSNGHPNRGILNQLCAHNYSTTITQPIFRLVNRDKSDMNQANVVLEILDNAPVGSYTSFRYHFSVVNLSGKIEHYTVPTEAPLNPSVLSSMTIIPNEMSIRDNVVYHASNVVGLVADGAIIESGTNANGRYVKYRDGTMTCFIPVKLLSSTGVTNWTYPAVFISPPATFGSERASGVARIIALKFNLPTAVLAPVYAYAYDTVLQQIACSSCLFAIGRWKE